MSTNNINSTKHFNLNTNMKDYIGFKIAIPYDFEIDRTNYHFFTSDSFNGKIRNRTNIIYFQRKYIEKQSVPPTSSCFHKLTFDTSLLDSMKGLDLSFIKYSFYITYIQVQVELFEDEYEQFKNSEDFIKICSFILQGVLNVFANQYNEKMGGKEYFKPNVNLYGPFDPIIYKNGEKLTYGYITTTYELNNPLKCEPINKYDGKMLSWRLYYNRAKNSFKLLDYLDTVLFGAISLESYVMWAIRENNLEEEFSQLKSHKKNNVSFRDEVQLLKNNNCIDDIKEKTIIYVFNQIKEYRNDIVHGNIYSYYVEEQKAINTIGFLQGFYEKYEKGKNI